MDDDFNTALAISDLFGFFKKIKSELTSNAAVAGAMVAQIKKTYSLLGLFKSDAKSFLSEKKAEIPQEIIDLAEKMQEARKTRDYVAADAFRAEINAAGYNVAINKEGYTLTLAK